MTNPTPLDIAHSLELDAKLAIARERLAAQQQQSTDELNLDPTPEPQANAWKVLQEARANGYQQVQHLTSDLPPVVQKTVRNSWDKLTELRQQEMNDRLQKKS